MKTLALAMPLLLALVLGCRHESGADGGKLGAQKLDAVLSGTQVDQIHFLLAAKGGTNTLVGQEARNFLLSLDKGNRVDVQDTTKAQVVVQVRLTATNGTCWLSQYDNGVWACGDYAFRVKTSEPSRYALLTEDGYPSRASFAGIWRLVASSASCVSKYGMGTATNASLTLENTGTFVASNVPVEDAFRGNPMLVLNGHGRWEFKFQKQYCWLLVLIMPDGRGYDFAIGKRGATYVLVHALRSPDSGEEFVLERARAQPLEH